MLCFETSSSGNFILLQCQRLVNTLILNLFSLILECLSSFAGIEVAWLSRIFRKRHMNMNYGKNLCFLFINFHHTHDLACVNFPYCSKNGQGQGKRRCYGIIMKMQGNKNTIPFLRRRRSGALWKAKGFAVAFMRMRGQSTRPYTLWYADCYVGRICDTQKNTRSQSLKQLEHGFEWAAVVRGHKDDAVKNIIKYTYELWRVHTKVHVTLPRRVPEESTVPQKKKNHR